MRDFTAPVQWLSHSGRASWTPDLPSGTWTAGAADRPVTVMTWTPEGVTMTGTPVNEDGQPIRHKTCPHRLMRAGRP